MPGNSLTDLPRHFSEDALQELFQTVAKAREDAGLPPAQLKDIPRAAATSVRAAVVADAHTIGGRYLRAAPSHRSTTGPSPSPTVCALTRSPRTEPRNCGRQARN
jgi:hypothetical protein